MIDKLIRFGGASLLAATAWHVGGVIPAHTMTLFFGFLLGAFVVVPATLIIATRAQTVRHDHYHHTPTETPREPQKQPLQLTAKPTHYTVVANRPALTVGAQSRIEVGE